MARKLQHPRPLALVRITSLVSPTYQVQVSESKYLASALSRAYRDYADSTETFGNRIYFDIESDTSGKEHAAMATESAPTESSDFQFNNEVANVFDDMLARSVPFYLEQQNLIHTIAHRFWQPDTKIVDLGSSIGTTVIGLAKSLDKANDVVGYDNSEPMIERAKTNAKNAGVAERTRFEFGDLNGDGEEFDLNNASVVTLCWTLQFVRPLNRDLIISKIYDGLKSGGALIVTDKVLTNDSNMNRFYIDFYYDYKRANGFSDQEILQKREALENVLIPYRFDENFELFRRNGFEIVETFFQWFNFAGFLCIKNTV